MTTFETGHAVTIDRPVEVVFDALALPGALEPLLRLSPMVTSFTLLETTPGATAGTQVVDFEFGERVPVLPGGLYSSDMRMRVQQTIDHEARRVDYRSRSTAGVSILIHKVRTFESLGESTRVSEVVHGEAPPGLHLLARRTARKAHIDHMERYRQLFQEQPR